MSNTMRFWEGWMPPQLVKNPQQMEENKSLVRQRFLDATFKVYASASQVIYCPMLDKVLSGYFKSEEEAWEDAANKLKK